MLLLSLTLGLFSVLLYKNLSQKLYEDTDDVLQSRAEGIINSIDTYWEAERLDAAKEGVNTDVFSKVNNINFTKIAQRWVEDRLNDPKLLNIIVRVLDPKGEIIASSKNLPNVHILAAKILKDVISGNKRFDNAALEFHSGKPVMLRVFTIPVVENNKIAYIVQVASQLSIIESALKSLRLILFLLLPLTVFLTGIVGIFLAKIALNPVDKIINTIHQITAKNLELRLALPNSRDEIRRLAETFNDMLDRLEKVFSLERRFIEDFAHELKTPLSVLKGELEVTLKKIRSQKEYESVMHSNLEEVDRIIRIVENLLTMARLESNAIVLEKEPVNLDLLLKVILDDIKVLAQQKNIEINYLPEKDIVVNANNNQLKRLFLNLLDNAIKYTPVKGKVTLELTQEQEYAKVSVSDTGIGIPEEEIAHIFDRFYLVDKSRKSGSGFGLGLSIVKSILEVHKGRIEVKSRLNQGATFTILLPLSPSN